MEREELFKILERNKTAHELPNDNGTLYNLGYVKCINDVINIIRFRCTNKGCVDWKNNNKCGYSTEDCMNRIL